VGNSAVQQAISAREFHSCDRAMVLTNSRFSSSARQLADSSDVTLVDREELQAYLDDYNRYMMESGGGDAEVVGSP
jgi:HJR/Mrr/RecB family endonuclease